MASTTASPPSPLARTLLFVRKYPQGSLGVALLAILLVISLAAPVIATRDPAALNLQIRLQPPSGEHFFGTDAFGRDIYARVIHGTQTSLLIGAAVALLSSVIGLFFGMLSGFIRPLDAVLMRIMDGMMAIPAILLAIALMALLGGSVLNVVVAITLAEIPRVSRLVRSVVLALREQTYVEAALASGIRTHNIILRHIMPNTFAPMLVQGTYIFASAMIIEAALSFIGAGVPPDVPTWGNIMADGRALWQIQPSIVFIPAIFLSLAVLAVNMVGDDLRDALDPRLQKEI